MPVEDALDVAHGGFGGRDEERLVAGVGDHRDAERTKQRWAQGVRRDLRHANSLSRKSGAMACVARESGARRVCDGSQSSSRGLSGQERS